MHSKGTIRVPYSRPYCTLNLDCICRAKDGPFIATLCPLYDPTCRQSYSRFDHALAFLFYHRSNKEIICLAKYYETEENDKVFSSSSFPVKIIIIILLDSSQNRDNFQFS